MKIYSIIFVCLCIPRAYSQTETQTTTLAETQTLELNFEEGKDRLLKENLTLLAEYYNLDLAEANIEQASLWENPLFVWNAEMYSFAQNKYFNFSNQKLIQLEYSFSVSGRRINAIKSATIEKEIAELAISDIIRGLVFEYSLAYYNLVSLRAQNATLQTVYGNLAQIIEMNESKLKLGVIPESDLVRLQAENLALLSEITFNKAEIASAQSELHKLLNLSSSVEIIPQSIQEVNFKVLPFQELLVEAQGTRPDLMISKKNINLYQSHLKQEKSEAVPRINLGYQPLDNGSNYLRPYSGMVFEMAIPIFNRNQGNINAAKINIDKSAYQLESKSREVESEVFAAYSQVVSNGEIYTAFNKELFDKMNELSESANYNYERRNITLVEYIDFQRAYIANQKNWIDVLNYYQLSIHQLNFVVGKNTQL